MIKILTLYRLPAVDFLFVDFSDKKVEQEKIDLILRTGQVAPTVCNKQPQKIYVFQRERALKTL